MSKSRLLISILLTTWASAFAKDENPADYPLHVSVLSSAHETQFIYRGTDCTSTGYGEITGVDTVTARVYTTCDPNWAAQHYVFTEMDVTSSDPTVANTVRFLGQCADLNKGAGWAKAIGVLGNGMAAAGGTPDQRDQANRNARRAQPVPPSSKCVLFPGNYSGRFENGVLEVLLPGSKKDKYDSVHYKLTPVVMKQ
jgi:hypothetical protein